MSEFLLLVAGFILGAGIALTVGVVTVARWYAAATAGLTPTTPADVDRDMRRARQAGVLIAMGALVVGAALTLGFVALTGGWR